MANVLRHNGKALYFGGTAYLERITSALGRHVPITEQYIFKDDAQRIADCHDSQDALTALIDIFQVSRKLLVLSFDAHPSQYSGFHQKLRSRLVSGLVVEIKQPDMDIRQQYVQRKNMDHNFCLSKKQILEISQRYHDIRSIDGALARISAYHALSSTQSTNAGASDILSVLDQGKGHAFLTPTSVILAVAKEFSLPSEEITGKSKDKAISLARHIAIFLCRELLGLSLIQTGRIFSGRDHSSVLYSIKKVKQLQEGDKVMHKRVEELRKLCLTRH
jgi:chromosomal replication initiator protein